MQTSPLTFEDLYKVNQIVVQAKGWKSAVDEIARFIRPHFIFDNLVIYFIDPNTKHIDTAYARAMGRGKKAEADVSWGETVAAQVCNSGQMKLIEPDEPMTIDRLRRPYILGVPLSRKKNILGTIIFIRFGSPPFTEDQIEFAQFMAGEISLLIDDDLRSERLDELEAQHHIFRLQEDFMSTLSHEIRTPLGFIKGYTTTLLRPDTSWDAHTQREFLQIVDNETDRLQELIDDLLDSARLQSGRMQMNFQVVRLDAVINDLIMRMHLHQPDMVINLDCDQPLNLIEGDPVRLAQVLQNLLNNAAKYAPGSEVWVNIRNIENGAQIDVIDHGPGIPPQYVPYIFDRFFRNPEQAPNVHGNGLGLFICKQIIEAHQGDISVKSTPGVGSTFTVFLRDHI
ncbi:GAF domain-containing sensor histidine kinase [Longilinea arvoryzae]|uniref:GAF domain-containing sensor histidine kinase n=1 Tax=Longilinea arvoryzae TaxID=360412 RepID=UPI001F2C95C6|nr:GAF domain-containing sensor histidine kinase [Longilinea arvoryzae]